MSVEIKSEYIEKAANGANTLAEKSSTDDIVKYIDRFNKNKNGVKLRNAFNKFSEKDKMTLYKDGAPTLAKLSVGQGAYGQIKSLFIYQSGKLKATGKEMSLVYRFLVHMGILDNPGIPKKELIKNITKDAKSTKTFINVLQAVITVIAPEAIELVAALKKVIKTLITKAEEIAQKQMATSNEEVEEVKEHTKQDLENNLQDIQKVAA